jgi:hypothetical protein
MQAAVFVDLHQHFRPRPIVIAFASGDRHLDAPRKLNSASDLPNTSGKASQNASKSMNHPICTGPRRIGSFAQRVMN